MNTEIAAKNTALPATLQDRMAALRQQATQAPETWNPTAGESLIGELIGSRKESGAYGENFQILIRDELGNVTAAWLTVWLKENLQVQAAAVGDLIALTFIGKKLSPSGRNYNAYSLIVDKGVTA